MGVPLSGLFARTAVVSAAILAAAILGACTSVGSRTTPPASTETTGTHFASKDIPEAERAQMAELLDRYGLKADGEPVLLRSSALTSGAIDFTLYTEASRPLGLDLGSHVGQTARWYSVFIRRQTDRGALSVRFAVVGGKVVGAAASVPGLYPDVVRLDEVGQYSTPTPSP
jgi:hypothetical protein